MQLNRVVPQGVILLVHPINHPIESKVNPVRTGIEEFADVGKIAITSMSASYASRRGTPVTSVHRERALHQVLNSRAKQPSWVQGLMWTDIDLGISRAALWNESALPLPPVPLEEFWNVEAINIIFNNPQLFKIVTPINILRRSGQTWPPDADYRSQL